MQESYSDVWQITLERFFKKSFHAIVLQTLKKKERERERENKNMESFPKCKIQPVLRSLVHMFCLTNECRCRSWKKGATCWRKYIYIVFCPLILSCQKYIWDLLLMPILQLVLPVSPTMTEKRLHVLRHKHRPIPELPFTR